MDLLATIFQCIALVVAIRYFTRRKEGLYFLIYIATWLIDFTVIIFISKYFKVVKREFANSQFIVEISGAAASVVEFACFSFFFYKVLKFRTNRNVVKILPIAYAFPVTLFIIKLSRGVSVAEVIHLSYLVSSITLCLLVIPCMLYYYELFRKDGTENLFQKPSFIVISSFLLYCVLAIPFFLLLEEVIESNKTVLKFGFAIHLSSFCLLFLALTRSFNMNKSLID